MYNIKCEQDYKMELNMPDLSLRYSKIINSNKKNAVYIKDVFDNSTFRYRTYNVIQSMENSNKYTVSAFLVRELYMLYEIVDKLDIIILQRAKWSFELENFIIALKQANKIVIYDIDDMIYNTNYVPEYLNSIGDYKEFTINSFFALAKRYELVINKCDGVIATTNSLKKKIEDDLKVPVFKLNNYLNKEQLEASDIVVSKKNNYDDKKFVIGYFSGSNSHKRDLEIAESGLVKLMQKYDNVYLKIVGFMDLSDEMKKLKKEGRIIFSKFVPYEELQYEIGKVDLNIIPLQKHRFNACKSELKYFEASIVNTLSLATDNEVYKEIIKDGVDGFLANELEWFEKLEYIYLNYRNLNGVVRAANEKCHAIYDYDKQIKKIEKIYDDILKKDR